MDKKGKSQKESQKTKTSSSSSSSSSSAASHGKDAAKHKTHKKKGSSFTSIIVLSVIVLVVAQFIRIRTVFNDPIKVSHVKFNGDTKIRDKIIADRKPILLTETLSGNALWDISKLSEESKLSETKITVQAQKDGKFAYYDESKPLSQYDYIKSIGAPQDVETITVGKFFTTPELKYYEAVISKDFGNHLDLLPKGVSPQQNLILLTKNSLVVPRHSHHNSFYAVLDGKVDFVFFPPSDALNLYPYPFLHPNFGSAHVTYEDGITLQRAIDYTTRFTRATLATPHTVRARKGDVVFVPPYWFVQTIALEGSIIVKSQSSSYEGEVLESLLPLEIPTFSAFDMQTVFLKKFIIELDEHFFHNTSDALILSLVESRYKQTYYENHLSTTSDYERCRYPDADVYQEAEEDLAKPMEGIKEALKELEDHPAIKKTIIFNLIESVVSKCLDPEEAYFFFANCFYSGVLNAKSVPQSE